MAKDGPNQAQEEKGYKKYKYRCAACNVGLDAGIFCELILSDPGTPTFCPITGEETEWQAVDE